MTLTPMSADDAPSADGWSGDVTLPVHVPQGSTRKTHVPQQFGPAAAVGERRYRPRLRTRRFVLGLAFAGLGVAAGWWAWVDAASLVSLRGHNVHVLLAPLAIAFLAVRRRERLPHIRVNGRFAGPALAACGLASLWAGGQTGISMLYHLGALLLPVGAIVSLCGRSLLLRMLPVFFASLFLIPLPGRFRDLLGTPILATVRGVVTNLFDLLGLADPVARVGYVRVADACDALPLVTAVVVVVYTYVFCVTLRNTYRWLLLGAGVLAAVGLGVVRAVPVLWLLSHALEADDPLAWERRALVARWLADALLPVVALLLVILFARLLDWAGLRLYRYHLAG